MTGKDITQLYRQAVIEHSRRPLNLGRMSDATHRARGYNPVCGDAVTLYLRVDGDTIRQATFEGDCCAVCTCSASLLTEHLRDTPIPIFYELLTDFDHLLKNPTATAAAELKELSVFEGIREFPSRVTCASLPWHTARAALNNESEVSTE